jgi:hypothetical protein
MPQGFSLSSELDNNTNVGFKKILIQGQVSAGKSWLAASAASKEKKCRFFEFDGKALALCKHKNAEFVYVKSYVDKTAQQGPVPEPRAAVEFINDIGTLEYEKKQGTYESCINVIDSLTFLEIALCRMSMFKNAKARKEVQVGSTRFNITDGWDAYKDSVATLQDGILNRLFLLDDLIVCAHERPEEEASSTEKDKKKRLTGRYSLHPPRIDFLKSLFNDKYRILPRLTAGGDFQVQLETNDDFLGANTLFGVNAVEVADLAMLEAKSRAFKEKNKTK